MEELKTHFTQTTNYEQSMKKMIRLSIISYLQRYIMQKEENRKGNNKQDIPRINYKSKVTEMK